MADFQKILTDRYGLTNSHTIAVAEQAGAYATARRALLQIKPSRSRPRSRQPTFAVGAAPVSLPA